MNHRSTPTEPKHRGQGPDGSQDRAGAEDGIRAGGQGGWIKLVFQLVARAAFKPRVVFDLLIMVWAFRARDWYRRPPFLPIPPREYTRWRMYTAYGQESAVPPAEDVIRFARWRRRMMRP
jgi:hypothetical protein